MQYASKNFDDTTVTADLSSLCIEKLTKGGAPGQVDLTPEHVIFAHPILFFVVQDSFGYGVVVPLVKILIATVVCLIITEVLQSLRFLNLC